jgi:predicted transcriptional regulator YheO
MLNEQIEFLTQLGRALAGQFGSRCEVVIHKIDQAHLAHSIVMIENGQVTERTVADGPSQIVLESLTKDPAELHDRINYLTHTHDGRVLRSSTVYLKDAAGLQAILSLNFDISDLIATESVLQDFTQTTETATSMNLIPQNVTQLLDDLIAESVKQIGKPVALMNKTDKVHCIHYLNQHGAFLVTKSGDKVAAYFNISKYTLYSYIDQK